MIKEAFKKKIVEFSNENKNMGGCYINTKTRKVEITFGNSKLVNEVLDLAQKNSSYIYFNSCFNFIFYNKEHPKLIHIKGNGRSRLIKLLDNKNIVFLIINEEDINYAKIKIQLDNIFAQ